MTPEQTGPAQNAPPPRVLMLLKRAGGLGGMQVQAGRVCLRLLQRGIPVSLLTREPERGGRPPWWAERLTTHLVPGANQWSFARNTYTALCRLREQYDLVHAHGFGSETFAAIAARRKTGRPLVVKPSTAGPGTKLHAYGSWTKRLPAALEPAWRSVDAWVSISEETRADLLRMGVADARIAQIPNGVDETRYFPGGAAARASIRSELGVAPEDLLVCTVARLTPHKRVDLLARAFLSLAPQFPEARLWVIGYGEQQAEIEALLRAHPAGERVRLLGKLPSDQVAKILQAADVFALVSRWEGLSNALLEAMACGVPVVVSRVSGMADVVRDGVSGLVVPPDDENALRDALGGLLSEGDRRTSLGSEAARTARDGYSLDRTADRLIELYARLTTTATPVEDTLLPAGLPAGTPGSPVSPG